jgi:uncharacterized protein DUF6884
MPADCTITLGTTWNDMTQIGFVSCSKTKAEQIAPAAALYESPLFRKSLLAALDSSKKVYILSAKHGVLPLDAIVEPYDVTLKALVRSERDRWAETTSKQLTEFLKPGDLVRLYCGEEYAAPLRGYIKLLGCRIDEPLFGRSLGKRLQLLIEINDEVQLKKDIARFYLTMRRLWRGQQGGRLISELNGKLLWPERGVYFITEKNDSVELKSMPRVIRVGTHAVSNGSRSSLWNRLSSHRGTSDGGGSHRSSIFRSHVGRTIIKTEPNFGWPTTWAREQSAPSSIRVTEKTLEQKVSSLIGAMRVLWIQISDVAGPASDRAYIERNAIGLLSRAILLSPVSAGSWLGKFSDDWRIAVSGLWNLNHLFLKPDTAFLDVLEAYVDVTLGTKIEPQGSIAPAAWYSQSERESDQLSLSFDEK